LGQVAWAGFRNMTSLSRAMVEQGIAEFWKMQSIFASVRLLHGGVGLAYAVQIPIVVGLLVVVANLSRRRPGAQAEGAILVAATVLCPPYLMDYDLVCVALPLAWVMAEAQRTAWLPWEKIVLLAAYAVPLFARPVALATNVSLTPPVLLALFAVVARRAALHPDSPPSRSRSDTSDARVGTFA
jgi:hypothetical protein